MADNKRTCSIPGCERALRTRGWCNLHYERWRRHGDAEWMKAPKAKCNIANCERLVASWGMCELHYRRQNRTGDPNKTAWVVGDNHANFWSKVDKTGACWEWTGAKADGYGRFQMNQGTHAAHRVSFEWANEAIPRGAEIDHMCHNPACVNPKHLRVVTGKQNTENLSGAHRDSSTGVRGVSLHRKSGKWRGTVGHFGRQYSAGYFGTIAEAEAAVIALRLKLHTHNLLDRIPA